MVVVYEVLYCFSRCLVTMLVCIVVRLVFMSCSVMVVWFVLMIVVYLVLLNVTCFLSPGVCSCIVGLCSGCDGCCEFCLICDACSLRCFWSGSFFVSSCRCCVFVYCVHPVAVLNVTFFKYINTFKFVEHARGDHTDHYCFISSCECLLLFAPCCYWCPTHPYNICMTKH